MERICDRIQYVMNERQLKPAAFARILGEKLQRIQDIQSEKQRAPEDVLIKIVEIFNINGTWLLTGEGEIYQTKATEGMVTLEGTIAWLTEWWEQADEKQRIWLEVQLKRCFPEYAEWTETQTVR